METIIGSLLKFLQSLFSSEEQVQRRTRTITKLIRQIENTQTIIEWEEISHQVKELKQLYKIDGRKQLQTLQKVYNRKGIELHNKTRIGLPYNTKKNRWIERR